jgi:acetyl-CoA carboxylase biotin carboxylase subunit
MNNFFPSPGKITLLRQPSGPGVRDDTGVYEGWSVPIDYDPLISKLAVWGETRSDAIARMKRALMEYRVEGIQTNLAFFLEVLGDHDFQQGQFDTGFIDRWLASRTAKPPSVVDRDLAAIVAILADSGSTSPQPATTNSMSTWKKLGRMGGLNS